MFRTRASRTGLLALCATLSLALAACDRAPAAPRPSGQTGSADPANVVTDFVGRLKPTAPYRDPNSGERREAREAVELLLQGRSGLDEASNILADLGFTASRGIDPRTGRDYALFTTEAGGDRPWGLIMVDLSRPVELAVEVPHPNSDLHTEDIGLRLFRAVPGSMMLVAGAHRRADDQQADAAHNKAGLFQAITDRFAQNQINQIQLHGFAEQSLPEEEVVVSSGQKQSSAALRRTADALTRAGFDTCRAWSTRCGQLEGTTNTQAEEARRQDAIFIHLEITWAVRRDESRRAELVDALVAADLPRGRAGGPGVRSGGR